MTNGVRASKYQHSCVCGEQLNDQSLLQPSPTRHSGKTMQSTATSLNLSGNQRRIPDDQLTFVFYEAAEAKIFRPLNNTGRGFWEI